MTGRDIGSSVSDNARSSSRLEGYRIGTSDQRALSLSFVGNSAMVDVTVRIYKRGNEDRLMVGSPIEAHSIGRGKLGTVYNDWELAVEETVSGIFTRGGRGTAVDSLVGEPNGIRDLIVGDGTSAPTYTDESLDNETTRFPARRDSEGATAIASMSFSTFNEININEVGVDDRDGTLMCRATIDEQPWKLTDNLLVEIDFEFSSQTTGDAVVPDTGLEALAASIRSEGEVIGIDTMAIGTGEAEPQPSDTSLDQQIDEKPLVREQRPESVAVMTQWFEDEPAGQPYELQEVGLFDNTDRLIWRTVFDTETKTDDLPIIADARLRMI